MLFSIKKQIAMLCPNCKKYIPDSKVQFHTCKAKGKSYKSAYLIIVCTAFLVVYFITAHSNKIVINDPSNSISAPITPDFHKNNALYDTMVRAWNKQLIDTAFSLALKLKDNPLYKNKSLYIIGQYFLSVQDYQQAFNALINIDSTDELYGKVKSHIAFLQRELFEDSNLDGNYSQHFFLGYDNPKVFEHKRSLLYALEEFYSRLALTLHVYPETRYEVIIYEDSRFAGGTTLPDWAEAVFDGKIRIPISSLARLDQNKKLLLHELTHAFLYSINRHLPAWIHEGLAQYLTNTPLNSEVLQNNNWPTIPQLTDSFTAIKNKQQAMLYYQVSLALITQLIKSTPFAIISQTLTEYDPKNPDHSFVNQCGFSIQKLYSMTETSWRP